MSAPAITSLSRERSVPGPLEVYEAALRVCREEAHAHAVADAEAPFAAHDATRDGRVDEARERALVFDSGDDCVEGLADAVAEEHCGGGLAQTPLDLARSRLHKIAALRNRFEFLARVGRVRARLDGLQTALRDKVREAPVGRGRVRVVVDGQTEVSLLFESGRFDHVVAGAEHLQYREREFGISAGVCGAAP